MRAPLQHQQEYPETGIHWLPVGKLRDCTQGQPTPIVTTLQQQPHFPECSWALAEEGHPHSLSPSIHCSCRIPATHHRRPGVTQENRYSTVKVKQKAHARQCCPSWLLHGFRLATGGEIDTNKGLHEVGGAVMKAKQDT